MDKTEREQEEQTALLALAEWENILEKKTKIYSRLLTDPALAKTMEELSSRREKHRESLLALAFGKESKKKNGQGMSALNSEEGEV